MSDFIDDHLILTGLRTLSGLLAGLYAAFVIAVMPALRGVPDSVFISTMNRINDVIVNPAFILLFLGTPVLSLILLRWHQGVLAWVAVATAVAAVLITFMANIPLNDALAAGGSRDAFENPWTAWHAVRTAACLTTFVTTLYITPLQSAS